MDAAAKADEVRLRKGSSLRERLVRAGSGTVVLLLLVPGLLTWASGGPPLAAALWAAPLGLFLVGVAVLERNVAWIITPDGILIGEQRPLGQVRKRLIDNRDIADIRVRKNRFSYPASFSLACRLASGEILVSPSLPDITRVNEINARVARLLGLPDAAPVDNPLDAMNAEITLGSPASADFGRALRMAVPVLAGLWILLFLFAFRIGESELALGLLLPLGLLAAFALYRYSHRLSGAFWIIRHGEIRIERIALNGQPSADTIRANDVAAIEVDKPDREHRTCTISIRLHTGKIFRSPKKYDEHGARAVRAEIIRRLNLPPDAGTAAR
ncbi:hypothetical protein [Bradyrhizobium sp.]|uniref:hypothetical protein n=1 Tax=Bradyrhizobium sp. TaxID=376 RepID=UPI001DD4956A|nr:hypothetical protein [Bradyrhizobium sp.]MBI5320413.1 hypothetical protein [Bradyrhizobium sp.]